MTRMTNDQLWTQGQNDARRDWRTDQHFNPRHTDVVYVDGYTTAWDALEDAWFDTLTFPNLTATAI